MEQHENMAYDASSMTYSVAATLSVVEEEDITYKIYLVDEEALEMKRGKTSVYAEDLAFACCRLRHIEPLASHLFALRDENNHWTPPGKLVSPDSILHFRMRYFCDITMLAKECPVAADHLFLQCRCDFVNGAVKDFQDEADDMAKAKGLAVINMLYDMRRTDITAEEAIKNLKLGHYLPRDVFKRSMVGNMAQRVKNTLLKNMSTKHMLDTLQERDKVCEGILATQLQEQYVEFLLQCAPSYTSEKFRCRLGINPNLVLEQIRICPYESGVVIERLEDALWKEWFKLSDICDVSLRSEKCAAIINRLSGSPVIIRCQSLEEMESFVALLDGYNRLTRRFNFNLCSYMTNPSLRELKEEKCHGPMEKEMMWEKKLKNKGDGVFTICQSMSKYDAYRIDYVDGGILRSLHIESEDGPHNYHLVDSKRTFASLQHLINHYTAEDNKRLNTPTIKLKMSSSPLSRSSSNPSNTAKALRTCIRPSEGDKIGLKLFAIFQQSAYTNLTLHNGASKEHLMNEEGSFGPVCIAPSKIRYLTQYPPLVGEQTITTRGQLVFDGSSYKLSVAIRSLKETVVVSNAELTRKFLQNMQNFMFIQNSVMTAKCFGLVLDPLAVVMEYFPHGNLKSFLKQNRRRLTLRLLVDAAAQVCKALWWLEESHFVYQQVKSKNIFVAEYGESASVKIRLGPVSLSNSIHWTGPSPPTHYNYIGPSDHQNGLNGQESKDGQTHSVSELAHFSIWSYGTLLWEIFTLGSEPLPGISPMEAESLYNNGFRLEKPKLCPDAIYWVMEACWSSQAEKRPKLSELLREMNQLSAKSFDDNALLNVTDSIESLTAMSHDNSAFLLRVTGNCLKHDMHQNDKDGATAYDPWTIDETSLQMMERLGEGRYGQVNKALYTDPLSEDVPRVVAVKQLKQIKIESRNLAEIMDDMRSEIHIMKKLVHQNIVEIVGVCVDPVPLLVMEFVENGALNAYLRHHQHSLETFQLLAFARDVASGMVYLQSKDIVHRDLAARNILVSDDLRVKISDFGLARFLDTGGYYLTQHFGRDVPLAWYAPEVIEFHKYSSKSDTWSFGVLLWEMFSFAAAPYFCDLRVLAERLRQGQRLPQPNACPEPCSALMQRCWAFEAVNRPDFTLLFTDLNLLFEKTSNATTAAAHQPS